MRRISMGSGFVLAFLLLIPMTAPAQSIGVFSDASATSCDIIWDTSQSFFADLYLHVLLGPLRNFAAVEFRVAGLPSGTFPPSVEFFPSPAAFIGTDIRDGLIVAWSDCQGENATAP